MSKEYHVCTITGCFRNLDYSWTGVWSVWSQGHKSLTSVFVHFLMQIVQFKTFYFYMQWFEFITRAYFGKLFWTFKYHEKPSAVKFGYKLARVRVLFRVHFVLAKKMFNYVDAHVFSLVYLKLKFHRMPNNKTRLLWCLIFMKTANKRC